MMIAEWDNEAGVMIEREMTEAEQAAYDAELAVSAQPQVPQQVTMRQARLALLAAGMLGQIDAAISALPSPTKEAARIEWDYSSTVERDRALVKVMAASLSMDDAELDQLFITAAGL